jgi:hypothetical protein
MRDAGLLAAIKALDVSGLLPQSHRRLVALAEELGRFGAAVTALVGEWSERMCHRYTETGCGTTGNKWLPGCAGVKVYQLSAELSARAIGASEASERTYREVGPKQSMLAPIYPRMQRAGDAKLPCLAESLLHDPSRHGRTKAGSLRAIPAGGATPRACET